VGKKAWIIFIAVVVGLLVALVMWSQSTTPQIDANNINVNSVQVASNTNGNIADHVFGKADSKTVLIEYGDYQCPGCSSVNPGIEKITHEYQAAITFIFRNFPLTSIHQNALAAASAVEAAGLQGKYWEMHSLIYQNQTSWENLSGEERTNSFVDFAKSLGLDGDKLKTDLLSTDISQKIIFDEALGKKADVNSTPTFYLNGVKLSSDVISDVQQGTGNKLRDALDSQLKVAGVTPPTRSN